MAINNVKKCWHLSRSHSHTEWLNDAACCANVYARAAQQSLDSLLLSTESRSDCTAKCGESLSLLSSREYANVQENWWKLNTNKWRKSSLFFLGELSKPFLCCSSICVDTKWTSQSVWQTRYKMFAGTEPEPHLQSTVGNEFRFICSQACMALHCTHTIYCMLKVLWSEWKQIVFENHFYWFIRERMKRNKIKASCSMQVHISNHMTADNDTFRLW